MMVAYALCDQDCQLNTECGGHVLTHQPLDPDQEILGKNPFVTLNEHCFYRRPRPVVELVVEPKPELPLVH